MEILQQSSIHYPFTDIINPHVQKAEKLCNKWIDEVQCITPESANKFRMTQAGYLASRFFPQATYKQIIPFTRFTLWLFIYDDQCGPYPFEELKKSNERCIEVLKGDPLTESDNDYIRQLWHLREELLPFVTLNWMNRFIKNVDNYFKGMEVDTKHSYHSLNYPSVKDYMLIREDIAATHPVVDFIEIESGFILPDAVIKHPKIKRMKRLVCRIIAWCNDIYSWEKELRDKEAMNLVLVLKNELNCSIETAIKEAILTHNRDLEEFIKIKNSLPDFGYFNNSMNQYIYNLELFLQGHKSWYDDTMRYKVKKVSLN